MSVLQSRAVAGKAPADAVHAGFNRSPTWLTGLFSLAILLSAVLLFAVQPLFARMVLPHLGGTPATWNTCLVFFQLSLLAGYVYAHLLSTRLSTRTQVAVHAALLFLAVVTLPVGLPGTTSSATSHPVSWLLVALVGSVGLPFFALSATAPLVQRWFALSRGTDPYFLYAASNAGSLIGLLSYPFAIEPVLTLDGQQRIWSAAMVAATALIVSCGVLASRHASAESRVLSPECGRVRSAVSSIESVDDRAAPAGPPGWTDRLRWLVLSAVPSSLLLGVTLHISTDVAAVPLFWVLPLALYLMTFIVAFSTRPPLSRIWMGRLTPMAILAAVIAMVFNPPWIWSLAIHLVSFTIIALVCHLELAARRPAAAHLTAFYLWLSLGGAVGGLFNALVAPQLFTQVIEYPLVLGVVTLIRPAPAWARRRPESLIMLVALPLFVFSVVAFTWVFGLMPGISAASLVTGFWLTAALPLAFSTRTGPFALATAAVLLSHTLLPRQQGTRQLFAARSFFGVHRVTLDSPPAVHRLFHGTTLHGWQAVEARSRCEPTSYYHRVGPIGQVFEALGSRVHDVGLIGLGAGALACYGRDDSTLTFFEIDPTVERIARDSTLFTYLANARGAVRVELADGRVGLAAVSPGSFDLIVVDAFSSDAIPTHLLTREFLEMAVARLRPHGFVAFHISNRHLDLGPVLAATAAAAGLSAADQYHSPALADASASRWMVIGREEGWLPLVTADSRWRPALPGSRVWTDDFSNILDVLSPSASTAIGAR